MTVNAECITRLITMAILDTGVTSIFSTVPKFISRKRLTPDQEVPKSTVMMMAPGRKKSIYRPAGNPGSDAMFLNNCPNISSHIRGCTMVNKAHIGIRRVIRRYLLNRCHVSLIITINFCLLLYPTSPSLTYCLPISSMPLPAPYFHPYFHLYSRNPPAFHRLYLLSYLPKTPMHHSAHSMETDPCCLPDSSLLHPSYYPIHPFATVPTSDSP